MTTPTAAAKSLQSCLTLCDPIDGSPPGSPIPGILQARTLERVAISFSNAWKWKNKVKSLSRVRLLATPWTAAHQAPLSMGFARQECWSGVPLPSPTTTPSDLFFCCSNRHFTLFFFSSVLLLFCSVPASSLLPLTQLSLRASFAFHHCCRWLTLPMETWEFSSRDSDWPRWSPLFLFG